MASACSCHTDLGIAAVPCPDEVLARLHKVSVATLFQLLNRLGFQNTYLTGVSPRTQAQRFVGRAFTMRCLPAREDVMRVQTPETSLHRRAFETINPGVVAIPQAVAAQVADAGLEQELRDTFSRTRVAAGASLSEAFPPNERLRAEYEAWRQQQVT